MTPKTLALACALVAVSTASPAAAHSQPPTFSGDQLSFYLLGFVDGATPPDWGAVASNCALRAGAYTCDVLARTPDGRARCWRARINRRGRFLTPLASAPCRHQRAVLLLHE
jgi:hypothetical protein